ncbi:hypothetical protein [Trinickia sp.]|uniref:hypothetical protein n=1 Tax=Trinickia sp. TaxID=2571163 RepID=UPI003F7FAB89
MTSSAVQMVSGKVVSVNQETVSIEVWSPNIGPTTDEDEQVTLRLDSVDRPLILKTGNTEDLFIGAGDQLDVACIEAPERFAILGIRNRTDGSIYLVRTAHVVSARREVYTTVGCLIACGIISGMMCFVERSTRHVLDSFLFFAAGCAGLGALSVVIRLLFRQSIWPDIRKLVQPGGKREMQAAREALELGPEEGRAVRFL